MKVNSLVECIFNNWCTPVEMILPTKGTIYTVRFIDKTIEGVGILLEEIKSPLAPNGKEYCFKIDHFKEIQPPMNIDIEEITKKFDFEPQEL